MFGYCQNNPVLFFDPAGLYPVRSQFCYKTGFEEFGGGWGVGAAAVVGSVLITSLGSELLDELTDALNDAAEWIDEQKKAITDKLKASLARATQRKYRTEFEIHHIVAKKSPNAVAAANILNKILPGGVEDPLNKVVLKTSVHRRVHTVVYYTLTNSLVIYAYNQAEGNPQQQYNNVVTVLDVLRAFLGGLDALSIN